MFAGELKYTEVRYHVWRLDGPIIWDNGKCRIEIPKGFESDGFSIPNGFKWILKRFPEKYILAAFLHDYLYESKQLTKINSDVLLQSTLKLLGADRWRRYLVFVGVLLFGWFSWWNLFKGLKDGQKRGLKGQDS